MTIETRRAWPDQRADEVVRHPEVYAAYASFKRAVREGRRLKPDRPLIAVERPEDLPAFASEDEEHEYWGLHEMGDGFFDRVVVPDDERALIERARRRRAARRP